MHQNMQESPQAISLLDYTRRIKGVLAADPGVHGVWVTAELSDVNRHPSGHCYMELLQKDDRGVTVAKMRATIWKFNLYAIERKFHAATSRRFDNGMKVMLRLEANMHEVYSLSANILDIDPTYTLGDMERIRREILERLRREGILGLNKGLAMPPAPQRIAVISAAGAAGYGDFVNQIANTPEGYVFYPLLYPATMQGADTSASVRRALERVEMSMDFWDCVVIIRGGGATTDLNGFDDYDLARAVATFPIPVIVGIGHERDRTVLDEIACVRCKTPTAVASYLADCLREAEKRVDDAVSTAVMTVRQRLALQHESLAKASALIPAIASRRVETERMRLDNFMSALQSAATAKTSRAAQQLEMIPQAIREAAANRLRRASDTLENLTKLTEVLSPRNTLMRGYSITRINGKAVKEAVTLSPGDCIVTTLLDGTVSSTVGSTSIRSTK